MDPLALWSDAEPELDMTGAPTDHTELDSISPSLIVSSISDLHASYLLNELHADYAVAGDRERVGTLALDYAPPTQQHSHGSYPCSFSADTCPLNPFSDDPVFGDDHALMTPETALTLRAAARQRAVASPDTPQRPVGRRPLRHAVRATPPSPAAYREPPPYPGVARQPAPPYDGAASAVRRLGLADRSVPRLKVVRRVVSPALALARAPAHYQPVASPPAARRPGRVTPTGHTEVLHTKPSLSYVNLITLSLLNSDTGSRRCNEIYDFLQRVFPYFREVNSKTWKNDTRHALSSNQSSSNFCKVPESKDPSGAANRGALWMAKPEKLAFLHEHLSKTYYKYGDNIKEAMEHPEMYDELLRGLVLYSSSESGLSPCDQSPTVGSTTDSPDEA